MRALRWLFAGYVAGVLALTLWPSLETTAVPGWGEAVLDALDAVGVHLAFGTLEALANVALFVPFGLLLTTLLRAREPGRRRLPVHVAALWAAAAACGLSAAIETAQRFIPGRVPVLQDVVMNTTGAAVGAAVAAVVLVRRARAHA